MRDQSPTFRKLLKAEVERALALFDCRECLDYVEPGTMCPGCGLTNFEEEK